ncbi:MAG: hypothetical protein N2Z40_00195 [Caldimicrobium sp.]|nr:hypothetical protein [Caldimicrobium sp.]MCX7612633.1 hypothetical protein [Caldimicrobium sp.]MDW8182214.1 hypothetical protein [Caldimicrobium sp.]
MIKIRVLFKFLVFALIIKFILGLFFITRELPSLSAKEANATFNCPPEISDFLYVEREKYFQKLREIESRERELKLWEKKIEEQLNALTQLSNEVDEKLKKISAIQDQRTKLLVKAYSEMRPAKAAQQLMNMNREMAVKILSQLKSEQIASILSAMPPEKAAYLAEALSGYPPREY